MAITAEMCTIHALKQFMESCMGHTSDFASLGLSVVRVGSSYRRTMTGSTFAPEDQS